MNTSEMWNDFEKDGLLVKEITKGQATGTVQLIQDSIGLLAIAFPIAKSTDNNDSTLAKMCLLTHNFNTLKCSTDLALRGYYVQSQNILRVVYENWVAFHYLSQNPEKAKLWLKHSPSKKPPGHAAMLAKLGPEFSLVQREMKKWYSTLCSFAHTDPINLVSQISNDFQPNETSVHFGTTFNLIFFKTSAYTLAMWISIMLSTIKKWVPEKNEWHSQEIEYQKKLFQYIDNENNQLKKK